MKVQLKLYATLTRFLPPGAKRNEIQIDVPDGASVHDLLAEHNVPMENCHLILINGVFSPPARSADAHLSDGDTVAVWPPIAGG